MCCCANCNFCHNLSCRGRGSLRAIREHGPPDACVITLERIKQLHLVGCPANPHKTIHVSILGSDAHFEAVETVEPREEILRVTAEGTPKGSEAVERQHDNCEQSCTNLTYRSVLKLTLRWLAIFVSAGLFSVPVPTGCRRFGAMQARTVLRDFVLGIQVR